MKPTLSRRDDQTLRTFLWLGVAILGVAFVCLICLSGCHSPTRAIADGAMKAGRESTEIVQHAEAALAEVENPPPDVPASPDVLAWLGGIKSNLLAIVTKGKSINATATTIVQQVPHVEDKVPWWASLLKLLAWVAGFGLVAWLLWTTGIGALIKRFVWGLGLFIPKAKVSSAKLDAEALEDPAKLPQAIASRRTIDPAYNAAFEKIKAEKEPTP